MFRKTNPPETAARRRFLCRAASGALAAYGLSALALIGTRRGEPKRMSLDGAQVLDGGKFVLIGGWVLNRSDLVG